MTQRLRETRIADLNRGVYNSILMHYKVNCVPTSLEGATVTLTCKNVPFDDTDDSTSAVFIIAGEIDPEDPSKVLFPITAEQSQLDPNAVYYADIVVVEDNIPLRKAILSFGITAGASNANSASTSTDGAVGSGIFINDTGYQIVNVEVMTGERGEEGVSVTSAFINSDGHLIITLSDGNQVDAGQVSDYSETLNNFMVKSLEMTADDSTVYIVLDKFNLLTGTTDTESIALPVANEAQAGAMNGATYRGIELLKNQVASLQNEAFAATGVPEDYTRQDITDAWLAASGEAEVHNGAVLWDVDNQRRFGYYGTSAGDQWILTNSGGGSTPIAGFTNAILGLIKGDGSTPGKLFAESDNTGSVNGWDDHSSAIASLQSAVPNKLDKITTPGTLTRAYTVSTDGAAQGSMPIAEQATSNTLMVRTADGKALSATPSNSDPTNTVANKDYVSGVLPRENKVAYGCVVSATPTTMTLSSGVAIINGSWVLINEQTLPSSTTIITAGNTGYITLDSTGTLKAYADSAGKFPLYELPVAVIAKNSSNNWLPTSIINFNMVTSDNIDFATFPTVTTNTEAISVNLTSATYTEFLTLDITGIPAWANALYVYAPLNQQKITGGTAVVDIYSRVRFSTDTTPQYYVRQTVANQYEGATQPLCSLIPIGGNDDVTLVFEHRGATNIQINTSLPMGAVIVIPVRI